MTWGEEKALAERNFKIFRSWMDNRQKELLDAHSLYRAIDSILMLGAWKNCAEDEGDEAKARKIGAKIEAIKAEHPELAEWSEDRLYLELQTAEEEAYQQATEEGETLPEYKQWLDVEMRAENGRDTLNFKDYGDGHMVHYDKLGEVIAENLG